MTINTFLKAIALTLLMPFAALAHDIEDAFRNPPRSAKTGVWWHWMGSNISKDGIVKDLEWFNRTGIGAATIFGMCDICTPWASKIDNPPGGKILAFSPEWWRLVRFACDEAEKRGIELGLHNCPGYTSTGGPWIPPRLAMRELVFNVTNAGEQISLEAHAMFPVENGVTGAFEKPQIPSRRTDLEEIAVVDGVRVQHIPMGAFTQPNQWEIFGLECDKMNPEAVAFHLDYVIADMKKYLGRHVGTTLKFVLLDSYEAGRPTWTPDMRAEFKARRGYDPLPFLPVLGGFKTAAAPDAAAEKKFKDDYDRTIKDLYRDVLFRIMREKLNAEGLEFACEPYGGPFDSRECSVHVDRLMTEFWFRPAAPRTVQKPLGWNEWTGPGGKRHNVIEAEAFTSGPGHCNWNETPYLLKAIADVQFCRGINRMTLHTCPHQPWPDEMKPGKSMGRWGTHFGRNQTWAESGKGFFDYLNRAQALLQWGEPSKMKVAFVNSEPKKAPLAAICRESGGRFVIFVSNHSSKTVRTEVSIPGSKYDPEFFDAVTGGISPLPVKGGRVPLKLAPCGSGFIVLRRKIGDDERAATAFNGGAASCTQSVELKGSWDITFAGRKVKMAKLADWTKSHDEDIRYFSGTAVYSKVFDLENTEAKKLSLGNANRQVAKVVLNGRDLGTLWCAPYEVMVPGGLLKNKGNVLEVEFTNVWANRLIGDEQEESDCDFVKAPLPGGTYMKSYPEWFAKGLKARPSQGRRCFTDWNYFTKDSKLIPSGLLGPVRFITP